MKEFLLSDETVNSHGHIVVTDGIRLERFLKNPVMFYNHDENKGVVGRWENIRKQDGKLYGTPVFDVCSETGRQLKQQVESGFIRGASIGIGEIKYGYDPVHAGVEVVRECELVEVSVCDIPSNRNTLQLYYNKKPVDLATYKRLSSSNKEMTQQEINEILSALGLPENATVPQVIEVINQLKEKKRESEGEMIAAAIEHGYIKSDERDMLTASFAGNITGLKLFLDSRKTTFKAEIDKEYVRLLDKYPDMRKLSREDLKGFMSSNLALFRQVVEHAKPFRRVMDDICQTGREEPMRLNWTLDDYRRKAPMELKRNPALYRELLNKNINLNK